MPISKAERAELRSIVKQRMKVLRADVAQREAEMCAEVDREVHRDMAGEDAVWTDIDHGMGELNREMNRRANDLLREKLGPRWTSERLLIQVQQTMRIRATVAEENPATTPSRHQLAREGRGRIDAMVADAKRRLERIEADLLTELTIGALESDEAKAFLGRIPTVGELVSAERLREITGT